MPFVHSWYKPKISTKINDNVVINHLIKIDVFIVIIIGIIIIISTSKIKKIAAIKKKWIENGIRLVDIELKPHSKEDSFSLFIIDFFVIKLIININTITIVKLTNINIIEILIIHSF